MDTITYSLSNNDQNSDLYYKDVSFFSDVVLNKLQSEANLIIDDFVKYIKRNNLEKCRTHEEYMIEFLSMGAFLYVYAVRGRKLKPIPQKLLSYLSRIRGKNSLIKPVIDKSRGILSTIFLTVDKRTDTRAENLSLKDFANLLKWMEASGDFRLALERLKDWHKFLNSKSELYANNVINESVSFAKWFKLEGRQVLGKYTSAVYNFLSDKYPEYRFREDIIFCGREEIEYHLNMVGAELLNRAFREDFIKTKVKIVLLPACMRFHTQENCKAIHRSDGYECANCTEECNVCKLTKIGIQNNFEVYIIPHESDAFAKGMSLKGEVGIVGVACVLNLLEGGWKAKALNFIPQCVLLDYCGCRNHWHLKGFATDINMHQLKRVLQIRS